MINVLLVDDHPVVRSGFRRLLEQSGEIRVVAEASDAETAYAVFVESAPDVCATDLSLPGASGFDLMSKIIARDTAARVVIFTMFDSMQLVRRVFDAGARGFVSKKAPPDSLVAAVCAVHSGERYLSPGLSLEILRPAVDDEAARIASLSHREFVIFRLLAQGHSPGDCARLLNLSVKTVANNQTLIKEKLGVKTSAALVHLALRNEIIVHDRP